jgi:UDP-N-acetylglucosamine--N-acetylmuramyl-(pentapeptide) pyrophosphoryl-undecaprenol N-acetylglucosamine transferase
VLVGDSEVTPEGVERTVIPLARDRQRLPAMGSAAGAYGRRDGDEAQLDDVCEVVGR